MHDGMPGSVASVASSVDRGLSPRQAQVADLLDQGLTQAQVADELGISLRTVETYAARIRAKLGHSSTRRALGAWRAPRP